MTLLLKQVDQIIKDAKLTEPDKLSLTLRRIPHLIHLYSHCVLTLHADRVNKDLRFVGKRRILARNFGLSVGFFFPLRF